MNDDLFYDHHEARCQSGHVTKMNVEDFEGDRSIRETECGECAEIFDVEMQIEITYISKPRNHDDTSKIRDFK